MTTSPTRTLSPTQARPFSTDVGWRALVAACDAAVLRALELIGKRVARDSRERFGVVKRSGVAWCDVHEHWSPDERMLEAALCQAWDNIPRLTLSHGCCGVQDPVLIATLDGYVRDLVAARRPHTTEDLAARLADAIPR